MFPGQFKGILTKLSHLQSLFHLSLLQGHSLGGQGLRARTAPGPKWTHSNCGIEAVPGHSTKAGNTLLPTRRDNGLVSKRKGGVLGEFTRTARRRRLLSLPRPGQGRGAASTGLSSPSSTTTELPQPRRWEEAVPGSHPAGAHPTGSLLGLLPTA